MNESEEAMRRTELEQEETQTEAEKHHAKVAIRVIAGLLAILIGVGGYAWYRGKAAPRTTTYCEGWVISLTWASVGNFTPPLRIPAGEPTGYVLACYGLAADAQYTVTTVVGNQKATLAEGTLAADEVAVMIDVLPDLPIGTYAIEFALDGRRADKTWVDIAAPGGDESSAG